MQGSWPDCSSLSHAPVAASSAALLAAVLTASITSPPTWCSNVHQEGKYESLYAGKNLLLHFLQDWL